MFIQRAPACTFMKTLFTSAATANKTLMVLMYTIESNLSQDYAVCLYKDISRLDYFPSSLISEKG